MKREVRIEELQDYAMFMNKVLSQMNPSNENYKEYKKYFDDSVKELNELITNKSKDSNNKKTTVLVLESDFTGIVNSADAFCGILGTIGLNQKRREDNITLENNNVKVEIVKVKSKNILSDELIDNPHTLKGKRYNLIINHSSLDDDIVKSLIK